MDIPRNAISTSLSRRNFFSITASGSAAFAGTMTMPRLVGTTYRTFYISNRGSDSASGLSEREAWATLGRLKSAIMSGAVRWGDTVRFRAGDEFFGDITWLNNADGKRPHLTLTSYGDGPRPRISRYKICNDATKWVRHDANIWKINLLAGSGGFSGNIASNNTNVGFIRVAGVIQGNKRWNIGLVTKLWDFYSDSQYLYVYSSVNPVSYGDIRVAVAGNIINACSSLTVKGLELVGSGSHAFWCGQGRGNIRFENNHIHEIGGSALLGADQTRYGNGVELWIGGWDITVCRNRISDVYDTATTLQGRQEGALLGWRNCRIYENTIDACTQSFEVWSHGTNLGSESGHISCEFTRNTCFRAGYSWGMGQRPSTSGLGTHVLFYTAALPCDLKIERNSFTDALTNYCYFKTAAPKLLNMNQNTIALKPRTRIQHQLPEYSIEKVTDWKVATGLETSSYFSILAK